MHPVFSAKCFFFFSPFYQNENWCSQSAHRSECAGTMTQHLQDSVLIHSNTDMKLLLSTRSRLQRPHISAVPLTLAVSSGDTVPVEVINNIYIYESE